MHGPRWDLHHHAVPDFYVAELAAAGVTSAGGLPFPKWSVTRSLRTMDAVGTEVAVLSVVPGVSMPGLGDGVKLASRLNDFGASTVAAHPDRLRWFAALPQHDVDACLAELRRIGTDQVVLMSNVNDVHFGSPSLEPLWEALDERSAVVFVHPNDRPGFEGNGLLAPLYLWQNDTTRTILDFIRVGGHVRYPHIRWVLAHAGGLLPVLVDEIVRSLSPERPAIATELDGWRPRVFLDTASKAFDEQVPAIISFGGSGQVTFGSDYPWAAKSAGSMIARAWTRLDDRLGLSQEQVSGIFRDNAIRLFERRDEPAPRTTVPALSDFEPFTPGTEPVASLEAGFWLGGDEEIRTRIRRHNDALPPAGLGVVDIFQPQFSADEITRCRRHLRLAGIRVPLDLQRLPGPDDYVDQPLLERLAEDRDIIRLEPRDASGLPLLNDNRLDAVLFCAKGSWLGALDSLTGPRLVLAETCGVVPYLAQPINLLRYMSGGKWGALAYLWGTFVVKRPAGYRWLRSTRRE